MADPTPDPQPRTWPCGCNPGRGIECEQHQQLIAAWWLRGRRWAKRSRA